MDLYLTKLFSFCGDNCVCKKLVVPRPTLCEQSFKILWKFAFCNIWGKTSAFVNCVIPMRRPDTILGSSASRPRKHLIGVFDVQMLAKTAKNARWIQ